MSTDRIERTFESKSKKLSVFLTAGFPRLNDTVALCKALENAGADMIEIGIPFADPIADGPTIQDSSVRALQNGMSLGYLFESLEALRASVSIPVLLMGYLNPILQYGVEKFAKDAARVGIDGVILPDMPLRDFENGYRELFAANSIRTVFLVTSRTSEERVRKLDSSADAFLYVVASESVTGANAGLARSTGEFLGRLASMKLRNPLLVGFGIHDRSSFQAAVVNVQGAIVGSAFVRAITNLPVSTIDSNRSDEKLLQSCVSGFVSSLRG